MSYQVLARKWRPRLFREMVGQEHVLKALINALDHNRLHHAYLFTGTRGVGKTTIARILAKCLNCETGVSSEPCNQCSSCTEINEGRFVDLIEVDAASRTKVEDTRDLLENVQYAPTRGRYKVYLIDEVHMLSNSSFNALLKTLEEPPPHVKFLLATTDPHKLPVTVLSRCLQFSLKNMSAERIVGHLKYVLEKEMVPFEEGGLWHLGRAADGSMRDALSLTDQSIAFSDGKITEMDVRTMLGTIDQSLVYKVLNGLMSENGETILNAVAELAEHAPDYSGVLAELIAVLHRIAIAQVLPEAIDNSVGDRQQIYDFAQAMASEDVQLYYQTALLGRRDLPLSPDPRSGFEMVMLRMLAFKPQGIADIPTKPLPASTSAALAAPEPSTSSNNVESREGIPPAVEGVSQPVKKPETEVATDVQSVAVISNSSQTVEGQHTSSVQDLLASNTPAPDTQPVAEIPMPVDHQNNRNDSGNGGDTDSASSTDESIEEANHRTHPIETESIQDSLSDYLNNTAPNAPIVETQIPKADSILDQAVANQKNETQAVPKEQIKPAIELDQLNSENWIEVYRQIDTGGLLQSTVANSAYSQRVDNTLEFILDEEQSTLYDVAHQQRLADLLTEYFKQSVLVSITAGKPRVETPAQIILRLQQERQRQAEHAIQSDPVVQQLQEKFGAVIVEDSIKPIDT
ncbi:MAG: DNA polymerase III subunit gamma/tau [Cellvibrionaceae bacterium]